MESSSVLSRFVPYIAKLNSHPLFLDPAYVRAQSELGSRSRCEFWLCNDTSIVICRISARVQFRPTHMHNVRLARLGKLA